MKTFNRIMLVLLVVAFPLASWYYLHTGLNFRKQALKELTPKGVFEYPNVGTRQAMLKNTAIVYEDPYLENDLSIIYDQYKDSPTFTMIKVGDERSAERSNWIKVTVPQERIDSLFNKDKQLFLVDTSGQIRYVYTDNTFNPGRLVEHISIILPREVEPDIKMRQNAGE